MAAPADEWLRSAVDAVRQITAAVDELHREGWIHGDLKPGNILLELSPERDRVHAWIVDFGLARRVETGVGVAAQTAGTPEYFAPEQIGGLYSTQIDIFALGEILFELLTRKSPFPVQKNHKVKFLPSAKGGLVANPDYDWSVDWEAGVVPKDLQAICEKAMAREPGKRYASATDLRRDLEAYLVGLPVSVRRRRPSERLARWSKKNPALAAMIGVVALALAGAAALAAYHERTTSRLNRNLVDALTKAESNYREANDLVGNYAAIIIGFQQLTDVIGDPTKEEEAREALANLELRLREIIGRRPDIVEFQDMLAGNLRDQSHRVNNLSRSLALLDEAINLLEALAARGDLLPDQAESVRRNLVETLNSRAVDRRDSGRLSDALADYRRALKILDTAATDDERQIRGMLLHNYAIALQANKDFEEARALAQEAVALRKTIGMQAAGDAKKAHEYSNSLRLLANIRFNLARKNEDAEQMRLAKKECDESLGVLGLLLETRPGWIPYQRTLLVAVLEQASCLYALKDDDAAISLLRRHIKLAGDVSIETGNWSDRNQLATMHMQLAELLQSSNESNLLAEGLQHAQTGLVLAAELLKERPDDSHLPRNIEAIKGLIGEYESRIRQDGN